MTFTPPLPQARLYQPRADVRKVVGQGERIAHVHVKARLPNGEEQSVIVTLETGQLPKVSEAP